MSLEGKHAVITGGSRGIGRGIALKLAENRVKVGIHYYQNERAANDTLAEVRKRGSQGFVVQADITRPDQIKAMFKNVRAEFGKLDIFVSNARPEVPTFFQPPLDITLEQWDTAFDSQAKAFLVGVREAIPLMSNGARIFAVTYAEGSRTGGLQPWVGMGSAKAALESLVRYFAVTLAKRGITVNAISPGWTEDSVLNTLPQQAQDLIRNWHVRGWTPAGRLGTPADIGNVVSLFCSEQSAWITGQVIYADGGASLMNPGVPPEIQLG
ncbi:MAG: short-chain dehydrogenase [Gemmatimonadetes bacterium]|nr:MAG: short-chain dehydrogenase [Gemmatimonadota bacterium]PYP32959.1 MAG: short-chain dehydrogenase [Gemmatimonadota bacterium]